MSNDELLWVFRLAGCAAILYWLWRGYRAIFPVAIWEPQTFIGKIEYRKHDDGSFSAEVLKGGKRECVKAAKLPTVVKESAARVLAE